MTTYCIRCPDTKRAWYVGESKDPEERLLQHMSKQSPNAELRTWLAKLRGEGRWPVLEILEEETECEAILRFTQLGHPLINTNLAYGCVKEVLSVRLTAEARRILDEECKRLGIKRGEALELILREIRELRKK